MNSRCEIVGWLLDTDKARVLVREQGGRISAQVANAQGTFADCAIQTGAFRRGNPIVDPVTHETVGYEMEQLPSALAELS
jgi:hypothetical protein